ERDVIFVVDPAKVGQLEMSGQRCGFAGNAFHHVAISAEGIDVVIKELKSGLVVMGCEPLAGYGHADAVCNTLTERSGRSFDAGGPAVFGMSGSFAVQLAELLDVIEGDGEFARAFVFWIYAAHLSEVEHGVKK